jgi:ABC-type uncharacterized transport system involved in gliding motility auxiliary subunit/ABC-type transport system involved in multi-copper enzyme maturation permease subunit
MMRAAVTVARRDLRALFDHPTGYILLIVFLAVTEFLFFGQALLIGVASMRPMLDILPWILLFFVPAVTMRSLAEEVRGGTIEVVLAQPVTEFEVLLGKYLGHLAFVCIGLALTLPVPVGFALGADLQVGVIVAQYIGAALLLAGLTGVGIWASSVTPNQITAFIVGIAVMFGLILAGAGPLVTGLPPGLASVAASLSVLPHFGNITRGVIDLRDVVYFLSLAAVFLSLAYLALAGRRLSRFGAARQRLRMGTALLVAIAVVVNLFGRHIGGRLDLTPGNAYTLSDASEDILRQADDLVTITLYVSEELPPQVSLLRRDIEDLLDDLESAGGGNVRVQVVDPSEDEDGQAAARTAGVNPVQFNVVGEGELQVKEGYLGLTVQYADGVESIPFVQQTEDLEYQLVSFVRSLTRTSRDVIGFITSSAMPGGPQQQAPSYAALRDALGQQYDVRTLSLPNDSTPIPEDVRVIVLGGSPAFLTDSQAAAFDAFFERGGGALIMASGMAPQQQGFMASPQPVGLNRLAGRFGLMIRPNMVFDLRSNEQISMPVAGGRVFMSYPFWTRALSTRQLAMNRDVESALFPWSSEVAVADSVAAVATPLFVTTEAAGSESGTAFIHPQRDYPRDSLQTFTLAVAVNPLAADSGVAVSGRVVVAGSADFASDRYAQSAAGGIVFALNAVDWLAQDDALVSIRSKNRRPPMLAFSSELARDAVKWGNLIGVPVLLVIFGAARLVRRRQLRSRTYQAAPGAA